MAVPASFLASISFASLAVPAFLPCQYQRSFLGSTSSLAVPAASLAVPKASPMNPIVLPVSTLLVESLTVPSRRTLSPQFAVQRPQQRCKEGAQRRGGQRRQDRVLARDRRLRTERGPLCMVFAGCMVFVGHRNSSVWSKQSVLGISERDSVVHVDVVSINAD